MRRSRKRPLVRGLNHNYNRALKDVFKGAAATAAMGPWRSHFDAMVANGTRAQLALLTLARIIAGITLVFWKKGVTPAELYVAPPAVSPMRQSPYRVHVPAGACAVGTNQAFGSRCDLVAWVSGPATFVPRVNVAFGKKVTYLMKMRHLLVIALIIAGIPLAYGQTFLQYRNILSNIRSVFMPGLRPWKA